MNNDSFDDLIDIMLNKESSKEKLEKLGLSREEVENFMEALLSERENRVYNRILAEDEKRVISPDAFGFLVHLLNLGSIDEVFFEKVISLSMQLNMFLKKRINKKMMDDIVNFIVFSGQGDVTVRDLLDVFFLQENEIDFNEDLN
ncbi:MAG: hypothetical protein APR54_04790 [Candidatus Cloacimonas sp. SDB]|nr:MAG: hypothetical protein APR54_04790 [Candidatus Cloacimonas sp. SDB]